MGIHNEMHFPMSTNNPKSLFCILQKLLILSVFMPFLAHSQLIDAQDVGYIYNGKKYTHPIKVVDSTPYFKDIGFIKNGVVVFDDVVYQNIPMVYDVCADALVVQQSGSNTAVVVVNEFVDYFVIEKDTIDRLSYDDLGLKSGYYERIYISPNTKCYAHHFKFLKEKSEERGLFRSYEGEVNYFVKMPEDALFRKFTMYKELLSLNKKLKREIKKSSAISKSAFKENPKTVIAGVLKYIDNHQSL